MSNCWTISSLKPAAIPVRRAGASSQDRKVRPTVSVANVYRSFRSCVKAAPARSKATTSSAVVNGPPARTVNVRHFRSFSECCFGRPLQGDTGGGDTRASRITRFRVPLHRPVYDFRDRQSPHATGSVPKSRFLQFGTLIQVIGSPCRQRCIDEARRGSRVHGTRSGVLPCCMSQHTGKFRVVRLTSPLKSIGPC